MATAAGTAKKCRATAKGLYTKARKSLIRFIDNNSDIEIVESRMTDLKRLYVSIQEKHAEYIYSHNIDDNDPLLGEEEIWIAAVDDEFHDVEQRKVFYVQKKREERDNEDA